MIQDRPAHLLSEPDYKELPSKPFAINYDAIPELVRGSILTLSGIQPVTGAMCKAADGMLHDIPSQGEVELFRSAGARFQSIYIVVNVAHISTSGETATAFPYSLTLIPASKGGAIDLRDIDFIATIDPQKYLREIEPCYTGFDPFTGEWLMSGPLSLFMYGGKQPYNGFLDELGIVVEHYFLEPAHNPADVVEAELKIGNADAEAKFEKYRARLIYKPFENVRTRRVWGAQSPIELFLLQELLRRGCSPMLQVMFFDDGAIHGSFYDLWRNADIHQLPGLITDADMYFPEQKVAVFCDSSKHHGRGKKQTKDAGIDERLKNIGVRSVRVPGKLINSDLKSAGDLVSRALEA